MVETPTARPPPRTTLPIGHLNFFADFTSRVWITYRSNFQTIYDSSLAVLEREQAEVAAAAAVGSSNHIL